MKLLEMIDRFKDSDRPAFISQQGRITYRELYAESIELARYLQRAFGNALPDVDLLRGVVVQGHKEPEMLIAFVACLRLQIPFIPVDSKIPNARRASIVEQSGAGLFLDAEVINGILSLPDADTRYRLPIESMIDDDRCMYMIFTSGSSGVPKGVRISYGNVLTFVEAMQNLHHFHDEVFLNQAPFNFDLSVIELWCGLSSGSTIYGLTSDEAQSPNRLIEVLQRTNATVWVSTPSFADFCLASSRFDEKLLPSLRKMIFCGEPLTGRTVSALLLRFGDVHVFNMYGPTETTCAVTSIEITWDIIKLFPTLPVGFALMGTAIMLVDDELVICGKQVGLGYVDHDQGGFHCRAEYEIPHYFTGDRGVIDDNGLVYCLGRIGLDNQVKIGGRRIDLDDIRANILKAPYIYDCRVWVFGGRSLRAEVVVQRGLQDLFSMDVLLTHLRAHLPEYMIPRIDVVNYLPLTLNGKKEARPMLE